jgi:hypothetical protein
MLSTQSASSTGTLTPVSLDWTNVPFNASFATNITTGTAIYSVEFTLDDVNNAAITPKWFATSAAPASTSASVNGGFTTPASFVRLNVSAITGTMLFTVLQGLPLP